MSWIFDLSTVLEKFMSEFDHHGVAKDIEDVEKRLETIERNIKHEYAIPIKAWFLENTLWDEIYKEHYPAMALEKFLQILLGGRKPSTVNIQLHTYINKWVHQHPDLSINVFRRHILGGRPPSIIKDFFETNIIPNTRNNGIFLMAADNVLTNSANNGKYGIRKLTKLFTDEIFNDFNKSAIDISQSASQKVDIVIRDENNFPNLLLSVKSFAEDNPEVNLGSFPPKLLFSGIIDTIPSERTDLGSGSKFSKFIYQLEKEQITMFTERVRKFAKIIYHDLHLLMIIRDKHNQRITFEVVENECFINTIISIVSNPDKILEYNCRVEGNAIRFSRNAFESENPENIKKIVVDL